MSAQSMALFGVLLWVLWRALYLVHKVRGVRGLPRYISLFGPITTWSLVLPMPAWNTTLKRPFYYKNDYKKYRAEAIHIVPLLAGDPSVQCGSMEMGRQIVNDVKSFVKPEGTTALSFMGENVATTEGSDWRRHRKVTSPAFDTRVYMDVWRVTSDLYKQMVASPEWKSGDEHFFENFMSFTTRFALLVIAACGFNMVLPWDGNITRNGLQNNVDATIVHVCRTLILRAAIPKWMYKLPISRSVQWNWFSISVRCY